MKNKKSKLHTDVKQTKTAPAIPPYRVTTVYRKKDSKPNYIYGKTAKIKEVLNANNLPNNANTKNLIKI